MKAGFSQVDITPPVGTGKIGWLEDLRCGVVLDPIFVRIAVFDDGNDRIAFVQLDTLSVRWSHVNEIRTRIAGKYGFPGENIMVSASHNHAGPAVADVHPVKRDDEYTERVTSDCVSAFGAALAGMQDAELGFASTFNFEVAHNRRSRMRDGTVKTQTPSSDPMFLCLEGPMDPEVGVLIARDKSGTPLGCIVNYACHPTHHGAGDDMSAGFPGLVCRRMKESGVPVTIYLNGAYGNVISNDFELCRAISMEGAAESLRKSVMDAMEKAQFSSVWPLAATSRTIEADYRKISEDEYKGKVFGAQRFRSDAMYEEFIDHLKVKIAKEKRKKLEIQVLRIGDLFFAGMPAEYFVEFQLGIKDRTYPARSFVVGGANGMAGYVPTKEAFARGGYETTLGPPTYMDPATGDMMAETAIEIIKELRK